MSGEIASWDMAQLMRRRAQAEFELEAKGYPHGTASAAVDRAWGAANHRVEAVRPTIRAQALYDTFEAELRSAEAWCEQMSVALKES